MHVFIPMEDIPFDAAMMARLVPYRCGVACAHALHVEGAEGAMPFRDVAARATDPGLVPKRDIDAPVPALR